MRDDFDDEYFLARQEQVEFRERMYSLDCKYLLKILNKKFEDLTHMRVLDFGCADGSFLDKMPNSWEKYGIEINKSEAAKASAKGYTMLEEIPDNMEFDLIVIRGVLHHLPNPNMSFFDNLTRANAVAILANPNPASILYQRCGTLPALQVSDNFSSNFQLYSADQLRRELGKRNFDTFFVKYPYLRTPYRKLWRDSKVFFRLLLNLEIIKVSPLPGNMLNFVAIRNHRQ